MNGVCIKHSIKPCWLTLIELIPIPFELLIANISWVVESNPWIGAINSTSAIVWLGVIASIEESSIIWFVTGLNKIKSGDVV